MLKQENKRTVTVTCLGTMNNDEAMDILATYIAKKIYELSSHINKEPCHMNNQVKGLFLILRYIDDSDGEVIAEDIREHLQISSARVSIALNTLFKFNCIIVIINSYFTKFAKSCLPKQ